MTANLGTAIADGGYVEDPPKMAPCALWETPKPSECMADKGPFSGCNIGEVYQVCGPNWWLIGGVAAVVGFVVMGRSG
jgi:hypothetical protein